MPKLVYCLSDIVYRIFSLQLTINDSRSTSRGFSLIEVLVAIAIVALLTTVAVPNFKNFSGTQELDNKTSEFKNLLRKAQSSALSSIQCSAGQASTSYLVTVNSNTIATLQATCASGSSPETIQTIDFSPKVTITPESCTSPALIKYTSSQVTVTCNGTDYFGVSTNLQVTLTQVGSTNTKTVTITKGGVIRDN